MFVEDGCVRQSHSHTFSWCISYAPRLVDYSSAGIQDCPCRKTHTSAKEPKSFKMVLGNSAIHSEPLTSDHSWMSFFIFFPLITTQEIQYIVLLIFRKPGGFRM